MEDKERVNGLMDKERVYESICSSTGITKKQLGKELGLSSKKLQEILDELYLNGFVDTISGKFLPVEEDKILDTYIRRNVDLKYLREAVDMKLVERIIKEKFGEFLEFGAPPAPLIPEAKPLPQEAAGNLDDRLTELEKS